MTYLKRVADAWHDTIMMAAKHQASHLQLRALNDLSETEFGYGSKCRLRNMWHASIDRDGDVVLLFEDRDAVSGEAVKVAVNIDQDGIQTTKNLVTGYTEVHNPFMSWVSLPDEDGVGPLGIWVLNPTFFTELCVPGMVFFAALEQVAVDVQDLQNTLHPVISPPDLRVITADLKHDVSGGYCRVNGKLCYFNLFYKDPVSGEKLFSVHRVSGVDALVLHLGRIFGVKDTGSPDMATDQSLVGYTTLSQVTLVTDPPMYF